jgi:4-hydroxy-4-methyl-2-oxoglutarate aldolase
MTPVVVTSPPRTAPDLVADLGAYGVATVHEAAGRTGLLGPRIRPVWHGARAAGTAVTVLCPPGDNLTVHLAIEQAAPGDIIVITTTEPCLDGYIGELITTSLHARGVVGLVTTTGIRDVAEIETARFPAWSAAVHAQGTVKAEAGTVNRPISIDGTLIAAGDIVVADADGVVVVAREQAAAVRAGCQQRVLREAESRRRYEAGELSLDVNTLRPLVAELKVRYVAWDDDR